jgi:hypothetical protein
VDYVTIALLQGFPIMPFTGNWVNRGNHLLGASSSSQRHLLLAGLA